MGGQNQHVYCIALRLRRTTCEDAYVNVPITDAIMKPRGDGTCGLDPDAFVAEGIRLSQDSHIEWKTETSVTEPHPTQQPRPDDRKAFDIHDNRTETHKEGV
jgi:hypothetical protein